MIINGNNIEELKKFDDNYFDSIVTDPPYEIGFMGKSWDASGIANNPEMWSECLRVLKPGGYLLSFSATRTYHRMAVAIEDSGFEIRDMIEWVYGSGFPKSLNIGKAVDKLQGNEREVISETFRGENAGKQSGIMGKTVPRTDIKSKGTSEWEGWGTALKPAHEPICMARKPLSEKTVAENCLKWGTGGINIDESRVGTEERYNVPAGNKAGGNSLNMSAVGMPQDVDGTMATGRFPANLIHDNSEEVRECFPETNPSRKAMRGARPKSPAMVGDRNYVEMSDEPRGIDDNGGNASRFFKSIIYQAKASKSERNKGCEGLEEKESKTMNERNADNSGISHNTTGQRPALHQNNHPTVKPVALMEYLIKMVTPTNGIVLDPFMGSGSTGVACVLNDFEFVGIDLDKDYCEIARARIEGVKETQTKMF